MEKFDRSSIARTDLNISDFLILEALLHKGPLCINNIGQKVLLTSGSMTAAANRLENRRLVKRIKNPSDGRSFYLHLTKEGRKFITKAYEKHSQNLEKVAVVLNEKERQELVKLLKKIGYQAQGMEIS